MNGSLVEKLLICGMIFLLFGVNYVTGLGDNTIQKNNSTINKSLSSAPVTTDWWAMLSHDPMHTGYSTSSAPNHNIPLWVSTLPYSTTDSSPVVADGKLYIGTLDQKEYTHISLVNKINTGSLLISHREKDQFSYTSTHQGFGVICLDVTSGGQLWYKSLNSSFYTAPAVSNNMVYILTGNEDHTNQSIICLDASTGDEIWSRSVGNPIYKSPTVSLGNVYLLVFDWNDLRGNILCLNATTGATIWTYPLGVYELSWYSAPVVSGTKVYITTYDQDDYIGHIYCLNAITGNLSWSVNEELFTPAYSSPSLYNGTLYVPGVGINIQDYTEHGMIRWYDADTGEYIRTYDCGQEIFSYFTGLAIAYDNIYMTLFDYNTQLSSLRCVRTADATMKWDFPFEEYSQSCPAVADGEVFVGLDMGELVCINAESGDVQWMYVAENGIYTSCAIADNKVFFASDGGSIYALGDVSVKIQSISGGVGLKAVMKNQGNIDLTDVSWYITLNGGFVYPKVKYGAIPTLAVGEESTLKFFIVGFGKTTITLNVVYYETVIDSKTVNGTVFLFFVLGVGS
jgi:eukaryotic-like serine/threonine-protein kinase